MRDKRCGSCRWFWRFLTPGPNDAGSGLCDWRTEHTPPWFEFPASNTAMRYMRESSGEDCLCYLERGGKNRSSDSPDGSNNRGND